MPRPTPRKRHGRHSQSCREAGEVLEELRATGSDRTLCNFASLAPNSKAAATMLEQVAEVLAALWPRPKEELDSVPSPAAVAVALQPVERLAHKLRVALDDLDERSRALLEHPLSGSAYKLDLAHVREVLLVLRARAGGISREFQGKGLGRPAHRARAFLANQLGKVFSVHAAPDHRRADDRLVFVEAALDFAGVEYPQQELRRLLATPRGVKA